MKILLYTHFLIWQAIHNGLDFLTVDSKIPAYEKYGLKTVQVN